MLVGVLLCILAIVYLGPLTRGAPSSGTGLLGTVAVVKTGPSPVAPEPPAPEIRRVWEAAVAGDRWPGLTGSSTGVPGDGVSLTFDDGPDPDVTPRVLDTLREHDIRATFFVVGSSVAENPGLVRRMVAEGHVLGNHTYSHADLASLSPAGMRRELQSTQEAVDDALGYHYPLALVRPPYGSPYFDDPGGALPTFQRIAKNENLFVVTWTVDPSDYLSDGQPGSVARRVVQAEKSGRGADVVLLHDTKAQTASALPKIIAHYDDPGSRFATVDELLADKYTDP